jgi:hypothetical protein
MSIYQYKDSSRAELWRIVQIQAAETEVMLKRISELEKEAKIKDKLIEDLSDLVTEAYHEGRRDGVNGDTYLCSLYDESNIAIDLSKLMLTHR